MDASPHARGGTPTRRERAQALRDLQAIGAELDPEDLRFLAEQDSGTGNGGTPVAEGAPPRKPVPGTSHGTQVVAPSQTAKPATVGIGAGWAILAFVASNVVGTISGFLLGAGFILLVSPMLVLVAPIMVWGFNGWANLVFVVGTVGIIVVQHWAARAGDARGAAFVTGFVGHVLVYVACLSFLLPLHIPGFSGEPRGFWDLPPGVDLGSAARFAAGGFPGAVLASWVVARRVAPTTRKQ